MENEEHPGDEEGAPINEEERELLQQDLTDVQVLKELLGPRGLKGAVFFCPDCDEDHFLGWDLLAGNLKELLEEGESPVHEPAFNPDPHEYVSWDYARGFLDGYESFEQEELGDVSSQLVAELRGRGWATGEIKGLLATVGLDVSSTEGSGPSSPDEQGS